VATVAQRLREAGIDTARLEAEVLVAAACGRTREWLLGHPEKILSPDETHRLVALAARRAGREPLAYVLGEAEFYSLPLSVNPSVIVPRPETELLAEAALGRARQRGARTALDVGTGCGALAVAMARQSSALRVVATDISIDALRLARENCRRHSVADRVMLVCADLLDALDVRADCIVANLPYIATSEFDTLAPEVRDFEPRAGLDGGSDGLGLIRRLAVQISDHLSAGGFAALEVGAGQAPQVAKLLESRGLRSIDLIRDYAGIERIVIGCHEG
jgi:release factor glutamine methyltransferase